MAKRKKGSRMTTDEMASLCGALFQDAKLMTEIVDEREDSLDAYNSEPYGNEEDGLSKFVASDVRDTIEWTLPQLVDIFYGADLPVVFMPENADDVDQAEVESHWCRHVFQSQNKGYLVMYTWFKDALMQKNGIVKAWWDEKEIEEREEYKGKDLATLLALQSDEEFEIDEITIHVGDKEYDEKEFGELVLAFTDPEAQMEVQASATVDIVGFRKRDVSQVRVEAIAPERFFVNRDHNSPDPQTAAYTCEVYTKTRSQLIEEGYDKDFVDELSADYEGFVEFGSENVNRYKQEGIGGLTDDVGVDRSREQLVIFDHYLRADFDGDGIAELRMVRTNGPQGEVMENDPVDRNVYHSITPYINTHKFYGRSVADNLRDLQKVRTQLTRGVLDNLMYSVIPRKKIKGNVNTADLMSFIPGGFIRMGENGSVENDTVPFVAGEAMNVMGMVDNMRAERTGFSRDTVGLNPAALSDSTNLVGTMILSQAQLLIKNIASVFANTGFNSLFLHIRELSAKYEKKDRIFQVAGEWKSVDPREWRKQRTSMVKTGVGYAAKAERMQVLTEFLSLYKEIGAAQGGLEGPLTSADGMYKLIGDIGNVSGVKDAAKYFRDPKTYQAPPPQPTLADATFKLQKESLANKQISDEAKKVTDATEFKQKMAWEREKFDEQMGFDREKFMTEMIFKYGEAAREGIKEFMKGNGDAPDETEADVADDAPAPKPKRKPKAKADKPSEEKPDGPASEG